MYKKIYYGIFEGHVDNISQSVITGVGTNGGSFGSLADVFSRGIIAQFPDKFLG